ncbi:unnamed protein product [Protopolystoma xenopodis]|uniref:Uncharacterized protein n=1 Tax=Protopolystoma xenopodis TaxID=117903 RepID=A0A448WLC2_9PLAT|nr:unnamed protein product [Protopolystoma xenopodis]
MEGFIGELSASVSSSAAPMTAPPISNETNLDDPNLLNPISRNTYFALPYSVHYAAMALPCSGYTNPDYARL